AAGSLRVRSRQHRRLSAGGIDGRSHRRSGQPSPCSISRQPRCRVQRKGATMKATQRLHELGQSLWLDNITREMLVNGTLRRYIEDFDVTGLTSNPTIFDHAIRNGSFYDDSIRRKTAAGQSGEDLFIDLALEDLAQAADLFRPAHEANGGVDGWVSMEVSPLLVDDTAGSVREARRLHARARRANLFIKIPGTRAG